MGFFRLILGFLCLPMGLQFPGAGIHFVWVLPMGFQMPWSKHILLLTSRTPNGAEESQLRTKSENKVAKILRGKGVGWGGRHGGRRRAPLPSISKWQNPNFRQLDRTSTTRKPKGRKTSKHIMQTPQQRTTQEPWIRKNAKVKKAKNCKVEKSKELSFRCSANLASFRFKRVLHKCPEWFRKDAAEPQPAWIGSREAMHTFPRNYESLSSRALACMHCNEWIFTPVILGIMPGTKQLSTRTNLYRGA